LNIKCTKQHPPQRHRDTEKSEYGVGVSQIAAFHTTRSA
jgi:hypothetical protein